MSSANDKISAHPELESPGYERKDVNVLDVFIATVVTLAVLVVSIVWLDHYFFVTKEQLYQERVASAKNPLLVETTNKDNGQLLSYGVVNQAQGRYRIPIEDAMRSVSDSDYKRRKQAP